MLKTDVTSSRDIPEILAPRENPDERERERREREREREKKEKSTLRCMEGRENRILENVFRGVLAREKC